MNPLAPKPTSPSDINEIEIEIADDENTPEKKIDSKVEATSYHEVEVKLCDFSFSQILNPGKPILGMMGTVAYSGTIDLILIMHMLF